MKKNRIRGVSAGRAGKNSRSPRPSRAQNVIPAVLQGLQKRWDKTFSQSSFGFRPKRSAHQAVAAAQRHIAAGRAWVVDIALEKFFDRVNHGKLMSRIMRRENEKPLLKRIRAYLNAGVMENAVVVSSEEGTPQGGPLTPHP